MADEHGGAQAVVGRGIDRQRFLFVTLGHVETDFYARVGAHLAARGHQVAHLTSSRRAARVLARRGETAWCLQDRMAALGEVEVGQQVQRITRDYTLSTFRSVYRSDGACANQSETWCIERTVRQLMAIESIFDEWRPDVLVPEVGNETIRVASHLCAVQRRIPVLLLFYTIFPNPLRLYVDALGGPIVDPADIRPLTDDEAEAVRRFTDEFSSRRRAIRDPRDISITRRRVWLLGRHVAVKTLWDHDNDYLRPGRWVAERLFERVRRALAARHYQDAASERPFVFFPLHVPDDYKIKRLLPHLADQGAIIEQVADALPAGFDVVVKEHPMAVGRTSLKLLRRLSRIENVRVVPPGASSHDLIEHARGVVVISSTVGLEALLYRKPVLTFGRPFYSGLGVTLDADSTESIREAVPHLLAFQPDGERIEQFLGAAMSRCLPGAPVLVDRSDLNAARLAGSLDLVGRMTVAQRRSANGHGPGVAARRPHDRSQDSSTSGSTEEAVFSKGTNGQEEH